MLDRIKIKFGISVDPTFGAKLIKASQSNSYEQVYNLVKSGAKVNHISPGGYTPLMEAVIRGSSKIVDFLIANKASVNYINPQNGFSALMYAARRSERHIVDMLLKKGATINFKKKEACEELFIQTAINGHCDIAEMLLHKHFGRDMTGQALRIAAAAGHCDFVRLMLSNGANIDDASKNVDTWYKEGTIFKVAHTIYEGDTALMAAVSEEQEDVVTLLLAKKADVNKVNASQNAALKIAAGHGCLGIVKQLLENKAQVDATRNGDSALVHAVWGANREIIKLLLSAGNTDKIQLKRALISAVKQGYIDAIEILIQNGADIENANALNISMKYDQLSVVALLLNYQRIDGIDDFNKLFIFLRKKRLELNSEDIPSVLMILTKLCEQFDAFLKLKIPTEKELELQKEINIYLYQVNSLASNFREHICEAIKKGVSVHPFQDLTMIISDYLGVSKPSQLLYKQSSALFFKREEDLSLLLKHVVCNEYKKVEEIVKAKPKLLLIKGKVTNSDNLTFENITAFQYALWSVNQEMWTLLLRYLPHDQAVNQFEEFDNRGTTHGKPINFLDLINALKTFIEYFDVWNEKQKSDYWFRQKITENSEKTVCAEFYPPLPYSLPSYPPKVLAEARLQVLLDMYKRGYNALDNLRTKLIPSRTYYGNGGGGIFEMG